MEDEFERIKSSERRNGDVQRWIITVLTSVLSAGVIGFVNFVFITGRYTEKFSSFEGRMATAENNINKMNTEGTFYSKSQLRLDEKELEQVTGRLQLIEPQIAKIPVIDSSIVRLEADVKELKLVTKRP